MEAPRPRVSRKPSFKGTGRPPLAPRTRRPSIPRSAEMAAGASSSKGKAKVVEGVIAPPPPPPPLPSVAAEGNRNIASSESSWVGRFRRYDPNISPERLRRMIANRISARKTRYKKLDQSFEMEDQVKTLENQIERELKPRIEWQRNEKRLLQIERNSLMAKLNLRANQDLLQNVEIEARKAEVKQLRELQQQQINAVWNWEPAAPAVNMLQQHNQDSELYPPFFEQSAMNNNNDIINYPNYQGQIGEGGNGYEMNGQMMGGERNLMQSGWDELSVNFPSPGVELGYVVGSSPPNNQDELGSAVGSNMQDNQYGLEAAVKNNNNVNDAEAGPSDLLDLDFDLDMDMDELDRLLQNPDFLDLDMEF